MTDEDLQPYDLGTYRSRRYFLGRRAEPNEQAPEEFAVVVYYRDAETKENVEVARVDTAHGYTHFDRLYRRDEKKDPVDWTYWEAVEELIENWRRYAEQYDETHGTS